jgi:hypothetical protein
VSAKPSPGSIWHFAASETPRYIGRAVAALAADPNVNRWAGHALATWQLTHEYGFIDSTAAGPTGAPTSPSTSRARTTSDDCDRHPGSPAARARLSERGTRPAERRISNP